MQTIETNTGRKFTIAWCGRSTIDFALRFEITDQISMAEIVAIFSDPNETKKIIHHFDEHEGVFEGFTVLKTIDLTADGVMIALRGE